MDRPEEGDTDNWERDSPKWDIEIHSSEGTGDGEGAGEDEEFNDPNELDPRV